MTYLKKFALLPVLLIVLTGCTETKFLAHMIKNTSPGIQSIGDYKVGRAYQIKGRWYHPKEEFTKVETGIASWYGPNFHGKRTANGEIYDQYALTAAHRTLQMPSIVRVTNLENGRSLILRVNDRGPFARGRVLDVSKRGAELLGFKKAGTARIRLEVMEQESRFAANEAKQGRSTTGLELALNRGDGLPTRASRQKVEDPVQLASADKTYIHDPASLKPERQPLKKTNVVSEPLSSPSVNLPEKQSLDLNPGKVESENLVKQSPPESTELFVQAGAFSNYGNAARLRTSLARLGPSNIEKTIINGRTFYRVRLGPFRTVTRADTVLSALSVRGNPEAMIVVQ